MQRFVLHIEYHGAHYSGWQKQSHHSSIQAHLESALSKVADHPISVFCAGRTDSGVHATCQVVHFDTSAIRSRCAWVRGTNTYLPKDIRVLNSFLVSDEFDARKSALFRRYCYVIANRETSPGIMHESMTWVAPLLNEQKMQLGANYLLGKHDFTSFRATQCQAKTPIRSVLAVEVKRIGDLIVIDIAANAFLHHMVRNIVGTLLAVGQNKQPPEWIKDVLEAKDRRFAGHTAPPFGLYLIQVKYPDAFSLPIFPQFPWFFGQSADLILI